MSTNQYQVYKFSDLKNKFDSMQDHNEDVIKFFDAFSFDIVVKNLKDRNNSANVFTSFMKENSTKAKIIGLLNKLNQSNLASIIKSIRLIVFQTEEELNDLVQQCIQKIKRDSEQVRPLVARLCYDISSTYFVTKNSQSVENGEVDESNKNKDLGKIFFRKMLLIEVKKEYTNSINYDSDEWTREKCEKSMILIGTLYNGKVIENNIMSGVINDFRNTIEYKEDKKPEYYSKVEKAIQLISSLVSCVVQNEESKKIYGDLDKFLENQMVIYEGNQLISKKTRLVCKNVINELRK